MKPQKVTFLFFLLFQCAISAGQAFNHFPDKQPMLFIHDLSPDSMYQQVYFDSAYRDSMEGYSGFGGLWNVGRQRPGECGNSDWAWWNLDFFTFTSSLSFSVKGPYLL